MNVNLANKLDGLKIETKQGDPNFDQIDLHLTVTQNLSTNAK